MSSTSRPSSTSSDGFALARGFSSSFLFLEKEKKQKKKSRNQCDRGSFAGKTFVFQTVRDFLFGSFSFQKEKERKKVTKEAGRERPLSYMTVRDFLLLTFLSRKKSKRKRRVLPSGQHSCVSLACYSMMPDTTPEPTVRPPSRIAKRSPCSIAIGVISLIVIRMLSPGMTISTPSGSSIVPVTSVVRK